MNWHERKAGNDVHERKAFSFEIESADEITGEFSGYAAVFDNVDCGNDIIVKGAFAKTIQEDLPRIKILSQHNDDELPIGKPLELREDEKGLYIRGKISDTQKGRDIKVLLKDGVLNELSIGYDAVDFEVDGENNVRYLKEVRLWEVSIVTWAMNDQATIDEIKSLSKQLETTSENIKESIKSGKVSPRRMALYKPFLKVLREMANIIDTLEAADPEPPPDEKPETGDDSKQAPKNIETKKTGRVFTIIPAKNRR